MRALIGNSLVKRLSPAEKPFEVRDTRVKGFLLRVQPSGAMTYYAVYGRGKRISLGRADALSPDKARERARDILAGAQFGEDPMDERRSAKAHTLGSFVDEVYEPWAKANIRTASATVARLKASFAEHLDKQLSDLTPWIIEKWRAARIRDGAKPATVNRDLNDLKSSLTKAVVWELIDTNPIAGVKQARIDLRRAPRFLSPEEESRLRCALDDREERVRRRRDSANAWRAAREYEPLPDLRASAFVDYLKPLVLLSLHTGMRRGELFALAWRSVDLVAGRLTVHGATAKSGTTRHIPLNSEAVAVLLAWRDLAADASGLVFAGKAGAPLNNVRRSWEAVLRAAEVTRFRWHDLRHTFASKLVMAGVDLNTVRELLGHSDYKMTLRYAHLAPEHKAAAVAKLVIGAAK
jgi:integrase